MSAFAATKSLLAIDMRSVARDSFLRWMSLLGIAMALLVRWGIPPLTDWLTREHGFDLLPYYPLIMSFMLVLMPLLAGVVLGFLLLDQKDDQTLTALQVTPLQLKGYLRYRLGSAMLISALLTIVVMKIAGLIPVALGPLLLMALMVSPLGAFFALFLAAFANNKVQGMALTKANGILTLPPVVAWFVDPPWQWAFGLAPTFWPSKAFWVYAQSGQIHLGHWLFGLVFLSVCTWLMLKRFNTVMSR
ncbi:MAG: hypothetical protein DHS20C11_34520 [Lysobacteraceae bacterium]|nr:MAG: hypothetical protein DHS20C11_34520 [Xanthomonadaceae bacterium]